MDAPGRRELGEWPFASAEPDAPEGLSRPEEGPREDLESSQFARAVGAGGKLQGAAGAWEAGKWGRQA